jgi:4a-hydroxytetrahydrobiopterin dehydratase
MKKPTPLKSAALKKALTALPLWNTNPKATILSRIFNFNNHLDALVFIARTTVHAQVLDHHPEILFTYKKVKISLSTHDVKAITKKDIELAQKISEINSKGG